MQKPVFNFIRFVQKSVGFQPSLRELHGWRQRLRSMPACVTCLCLLQLGKPYLQRKALLAWWKLGGNWFQYIAETVCGKWESPRIPQLIFSMPWPPHFQLVKGHIITYPPSKYEPEFELVNGQNLILVGGLEHVLFFHILEIIIPTD